MALLLLQLVQHEAVADDRGDDGERDGQHDEMGLLC